MSTSEEKSYTPSPVQEYYSDNPIINEIMRKYSNSIAAAGAAEAEAAAKPSQIVEETPIASVVGGSE